MFRTFCLLPVIQCVKIYNCERTNAKHYSWEQPYSFGPGTRNSCIASFSETTLSKAVCQKTFMGGEHIWCQPLFLLWIFLFNNDSTLTASLVVHMAFSLAPSHWAQCIPFHQTWLSVWILLKNQQAGKLLRTGYSPATFKVTCFLLDQLDKYYSWPYLSHLKFWFMVTFLLFCILAFSCFFISYFPLCYWQ